ncbi:hypothetical protein CNR22_00640 [Sphingobacteriaceae bacterium]|nr:hypothetical protein CNR22_00640 [Sphingobacteriaceae bacterium]
MRSVLKVTVVHMQVLLMAMLPAAPIFGQDTIKFETVKSVKDIPHKTLKQKWMWIHRSVAFAFMKERLPYWNQEFYSSYKGKLVLTLPVSTRFLNFEVRDGLTANFLRFQPNSKYDLGISINSRFASFLLNSGVSLFDNDQGTKGKTSYQDYQFNLYGKKTTIDLALQTYQGFYIENSRKYETFQKTNTQAYQVRPDVNVFALSFNYYYIFNYKRFSYRSSFAFTEYQKKSAGSLLCGGYFSVLGVRADSNLISNTFVPYFDSASSIKKGEVANVGINIGYIYTLVLRQKIHMTLSLVQGLGHDNTNITREDGSKYELAARFSSKQNLRIALGYDSGRFFYGTMGLFDFYYFDAKKGSTFNYSSGKFRIFVGYRFSVEKQEKRFLRKLNLIDYRL